MKNLWIMVMLTIGGLHVAEAREFTVPFAQSLESPFATADIPSFQGSPSAKSTGILASQP